MITITDAAAAKLHELISSQDQPNLYLRLFIAPGGCEGFSYGMAFDTERRDDDAVVERGGVRVLIDAASGPYIAGAQIDYVRSTMGEGFTVRNPNAVATCGCGHSFRTRHDAGQPQPCGCETETAEAAGEERASETRPA
ncbi:MAG TPA: iron-sulfur cluster insertion protein ErpA [bacterium]|nr:iron-sulfur cluster insertion protein ErpA [bacterium]